MEVPEGTGKGEWQRRQAGGVDVWVTGGGEAVLQLQHREDMGTAWGAERAVQMRTDRAVWLEPGWKGRYRVAAEDHRWWGWHMHLGFYGVQKSQKQATVRNTTFFCQIIP